MNLKDLYYFYDLSNLQSFTDVARKHEVSQPSISYAIKRLESKPPVRTGGLLFG